MINFYRRFIPKTKLQTPLNQLLKSRKLKRNAPIQWFAEADIVFQTLKDAVSNTALLAHPSNSANLAIMCGGECVRFRIRRNPATAGGKYVRRLLAFFTKSLSSAQRKSVAPTTELLTVYSAIKQFRHAVKGRSFAVYRP